MSENSFCNKVVLCLFGITIAVISPEFFATGIDFHSDLLWLADLGITFSPLGNLITNLAVLLSCILIMILILHIVCDAWFNFRRKFKVWQ